jgi:hypothetical protein
VGVPLQIQPEVIGATRESAVCLLQNIQPALLQVQAFEHGPLVSPGRFDARFPSASDAGIALSVS